MRKKIESIYSEMDSEKKKMDSEKNKMYSEFISVESSTSFLNKILNLERVKEP